MGFTFSDEGNGNDYSDTDLSAAAIAVSAGDLIVVLLGTVSSTVYCTGVTDTQGNIYTVRTVVLASGANMVMAYCIDAEANASNVVTASYNLADNASKTIIATVITPDSGETVTLDVVMNKAADWEASPWETGTDDTTGTDELCIAGLQAGASMTFSNQEIPGGTAATLLTSPTAGCAGWYRILTDIASGLYAEIDTTASQVYAIEMLCFKSEAAGGDTFYQNAGQGAVVLTGILNKKTTPVTAMGGHSMSITGLVDTAILIGQNTGGHAMTITGVLTTVVTFVKAAGSHAMTIVGTLIKKTFTGVGKGQVASTGVLSKKTSKDVGDGSVTSIGTLTTAILFTQAVGGASMSIVGSLATQFIAGVEGVAKFIRRRKTFYKQ